jgi:hypothetical protein
LPLNCAVVSMYSFLKQLLKCNTGKVCNCLIQFLLTIVLSIEERVFISVQRLSEHTAFHLTVIQALDNLAFVGHHFVKESVGQHQLTISQ